MVVNQPVMLAIACSAVLALLLAASEHWLCKCSITLVALRTSSP